MKNTILFFLGVLVLLLNGCGSGADTDKPRTILIVMNGLASGTIDRLRLVHLQNWEKEGCLYNTVFTLVPAFPEKTQGYIWNCPLSDPVLMTGTVFIGQSGIKDCMIQHMFGEKKSALLVNSDEYGDISKDFDFYYNLKTKKGDELKDELVFDKAKEVIENENPAFVLLQLQGPGTAGAESANPVNKKNKWYGNIWDEDSPYVGQMKKDDQLIEEFINWLRYKDFWTTTTLFITGNHGEASTGGCPPDNPESCKTEMLIISKDVHQAAVFNYAEITDIAPTIIRVNQLSSLRYSNGRILEEAFEWGPESFQPERKMEKLDNLLIQHRASGDTAKAGNNFQDINNICRWHEFISPVNLNEFIRYEEKQ